MPDGKTRPAHVPKATPRQSDSMKREVQTKLEAELERLMKILRLGYELRVFWVPDSNSKCSGEVRGTCIYLYNEDENDALETLKHEFIDWAISNAIEPYKEVTNRLIAMINEDAYTRKEKLVNALERLV
jgi:hypothetical protein